MEKTEIIIITGTPALTTKVPADFTCDITGTLITPSSIVRNLGVMFEPSLSFQYHINSLSKLAFFHLRRIVQLRPFISTKDAETLIHAFFSYRLDYFNALFIGLPATTIARLQYIQNSAARILTRTKRSAHITPILADLQWLPVAYRINFKIILLTFKALNKSFTIWPLSIFAICSSPILHHVHCGPLILAFSPSFDIASLPWGGKSFSVVAPKLWNSLPRSLCLANSLSEFKSLLKTHLFSECYLS